jgi:hypothetical protein
MPESNPAFTEIVRRHLNRDAITDQHSDAVLFQPTRGVSQGLVAIIELDTESSFRQAFLNRAVELKQIALGHSAT